MVVAGEVRLRPEGPRRPVPDRDPGLVGLRQHPVNENSINYTYQSAASTKLKTVTDCAGRGYTVGYSSGATEALIATITDINGPGTRTWAHDYTAGRLTSATDPLGDEATYTCVDDVTNARRP